MKLLSNKTYQGMVDAYNGLLEENKKLKETYLRRLKSLD